MAHLHIVIADADENTELAAMVALDSAALEVKKSWLSDNGAPRQPSRTWIWAATAAFLATFAASLAWIWTGATEWGWTGLATGILALVLAVVGTPNPKTRETETT